MESEQSDQQSVIKLLTKKMEHIDLNNTNIHETGEQQSPVPVGSLENAEQVEKKQFFISEQSLKINSIKRIQDPSKNPSHLKDCQYHCQLCNRFLAEMKSIKNHTRSEGHIERLEQKITDNVVKNVPEVTSTQLSSMTNLVEELYSNYSAIARGQSDIRKGIVEDLGGLIKPLYKDVSVEMFGSSRMSCALTTSDVNLNINIEDTEISQNDIPKIFLQVLEMLRTQDKAKYRRIQEDFYSPMKIPRIVFQHWQSKLLCELRIGSYAPTQVASLIDLYCQIDPRVSKLCVAMKYWAKVLRVSTYVNGHYPSVVFVLMVLHYLQQTTPPVIPVLHEQVSQTIDKSVDSNEEVEFEPEYSQLSAAAQQWQSTNTQSLGELLHGLLRYYVVEFDQSTLAVTIRQSKPLYRQCRDGWGSTKLAVEDPFLIKNNISKAAGSEKVYEYLLNSFKLTYLHMLQVNKKITKLVRDIVEGRIEELPAVDEDGDEDNSDEHDEEVGQGVESTSQNQCDTDDENIDGDKGARQGVNPGAGQGVNPSKSPQVINNEETTNVEVIVDVAGVRNLTEEILRESGTVKAVGKKTARKRRYHAQIMKAIDGIVLSDEDTSGNYVFEEKDFKTLLKSYPEACLLCRRARHTAKSCPDEVVPKFSGNIKWPPLNSIQSLSNALQNYTEEVMLRPNEETDRKKIRTRILQDIHILYPKASLELFGSSANQFGHCNSDLDLCLLMNEKYDCEKVEIIEKLAKHFKKDSFYRGVSWIPSARVPIIKLSIDKWRIDCDISMENCLALQNTRMLSAYAGIDTRVRQLGYTLKCFAKVCDMCDASSGSISSYGYILMLIHFLQQLNILPVLQKIPTHKTPSGPIIEGWDCYYFTQLHNLSRMWRPENTSLLPAELWLHFVLYFSREFDWKHNVVTIRQREPLSKFEKSWTSKPMAIEDPFNHDHNLAQAVSSRMRTYILRRFQKAVLHHQKPEIWKDIDQVMNYDILCGDYKAPKFIICEKCNRRGHRRADCPRNKDQTDGGGATTEQNTSQADEKKHTDKNGKRKTNGSDSVTDVDVLRDRRNGNETKRNGNEPKQNERGNESNAKGDSTRNQSSLHYDSFAGKSRSQIRQILQDQTGGSIEQLKKLQTQMKARAHSSKGTSIDKKALSVLSDLIKKLQKESRDQVHVHVQSEATEDVPRNDIKQTPPINEPVTRMPPSSRQSHKHRREHVSVKVLENKSRVPMDNHHRQTRSGPTVIVRPKMETVPSSSRPPFDAVPHSSYHVGIQHQMEMPRPHMPVPLLPSPTTVYNQSPPTRFFSEPIRQPLVINRPPLIPGSYLPSNVPLRSPSLLPNPPPQRWPPQTHPQWYPPPRGYN